MVQDIGFNETAKALNISHWTIRKWAERGNWFPNQPVHAQQKALVQAVQSPAEAHANVLSQYKARSTVALAKYSAEASEEATEAPKGKKLAISRKVKDVADIHRSIWPSEPNQSNILQIGFLVNQAAPEKLVDGQVVTDQEQDSAPD